jgi:toxin-antitoxin system PIN domain toxin
MTSYLIDVNVWLAITWELHQQHRSAQRWYRGLSGKTDEAELLFCRFTMLGFLRMLTNSAVMGDSRQTLGQAFEIYDVWTRDERVGMVAEPQEVEILLREAVGPYMMQPATKTITDCYLAGFAEAVGAKLVTFDKGLAHMVKTRKNGVVLLEADPTQK